MDNKNVQVNYDVLAENYAAQFRDELDKKPFDRKMLDWLIEKVGEAGIICDMGCGPGQIAGYLHARGAQVCGIDLSPEMVRQARILNPKISFQTGDMLNLDSVADDSFGGIAAFYSIVNIPPESIVSALRKLRRVLRPGGALLLAFHIGREAIHVEEMLDKKVSMDFFFFDPAEIKNQLETAGFRLEEAIERDPYSETIEHQSRRAYLFARN
jgi:SAM-dependent methyltransferase